MLAPHCVPISCAKSQMLMFSPALYSPEGRSVSEKMFINAGHILNVDTGTHLLPTEDGDLIVCQRLVRKHIHRTSNLIRGDSPQTVAGRTLCICIAE